MLLDSAILAGGKSRRFGKDKAHANFNEKSLIFHSISKINDLKLPCTIIRNVKDIHCKYPLQQDIIKDKGPLAGVYTALYHSIHDDVLILTCDMPNISIFTLRHLIEHHSGNVSYYKSSEQTYPFPGIYSKSLLTVIKTKLDANTLSMTSLINEIPDKTMLVIENFKEEEFLNINYMSDIIP